jgi:hypothetical protein
MSRYRVWSLHLAIVAIFAVQTARASVIPKLSFEQILQTADVVFTGTVLRVESKWTSTRTGRAIISLVTYRVEHVLKGDPGAEITLEFLGGKVGDVALAVEGVPTFSEGQQDVICALAGALHVSPIAGFNQGRFRVIRDVASGQEFVVAQDGRALTMAGDAGRTGRVTTAVTLAQFEQEILRVLRTLPR